MNSSEEFVRGQFCADGCPPVPQAGHGARVPMMPTAASPAWLFSYLDVSSLLKWLIILMIRP